MGEVKEMTVEEYIKSMTDDELQRAYHISKCCNFATLYGASPSLREQQGFKFLEQLREEIQRRKGEK